MQLAMVGLGKMGANMLRRLVRGGHEVIGYDQDASAVERLRGEGAVVARTLDDAVSQLSAKRVVWVMLPAGDPTEGTIATLSRKLARADIVIDGGNSNVRDSIRRAAEVNARGVRWLDVGTSGGIWGLENGYCLMAGGDKSAYDDVLPVFTTLAPARGLGYFGHAGAGHFAKMVHNGVEYAMMQSYAEGFELLRASEFGYDLNEIARVWNRGSVVRSWLLELLERALAKDKDLSELQAYVADSGEGRWTVHEALNHAVPAPTIAASLFARFASRQNNSFAMRVVAALRSEFGGHAVKKA